VFGWWLVDPTEWAGDGAYVGVDDVLTDTDAREVEVDQQLQEAVAVRVVVAGDVGRETNKVLAEHLTAYLVVLVLASEP
jgi:hypothetical protein